MKGLKKITLLMGDIVTLYLALVATLLIRYPAADLYAYLKDHLHPFSLIFILWIGIFFLSDLYQYRDYRSNLITFKRLAGAVFLSGISSVIAFYLFGQFFELTPKINLLIFSAVFLLLDYSLRIIAIKVFTAGAVKTLVLGDASLLNEIESYLAKNLHAGYQVVERVKDLGGKSADEISLIIKNKKVSTVIIQPNIAKDFSGLKTVFQLLPLEVSIVNAWDFYETLFEKVPLKDLEENWFIEKVPTRRPFYDTLKRLTDIALSLVFGVIFLPFGFIFAFFIKMTSAGPAIFKHERIGKNGRIFTLYKFRIMVLNHSGSPWTEKNDKRFTFVGKILNYTHLNEIPQLWNILKGDMSFIGPRPESKELVNIYQQLPYYELRNIIKPGLSGWAQINYKPSASLEEAYEKLRYDIYYVKNRSFLLDFIILFKTIKYVFASYRK